MHGDAFYVSRQVEDVDEGRVGLGLVGLHRGERRKAATVFRRSGSGRFLVGSFGGEAPPVVLKDLVEEAEALLEARRPAAIPGRRRRRRVFKGRPSR